MLDLAILGLLKEQDLHGYELKKRLTEALGPWSSVSFGSLYPALARLEAAGAVRVVEFGGDEAVLAAPVVPMTGSIAGEAAAFRAVYPAPGAARAVQPAQGAARARRASTRSSGRPSRTRKVYAITERGERLFEELLETESTSADDDRAFNLKLAFCRHLPPEARLGLFERRRAQLVERLAHARNSIRALAAAGDGGISSGRIDAYTRSLIEHGTETTERDISWLDTLIATERQRGMSTT